MKLRRFNLTVAMLHERVKKKKEVRGKKHKKRRTVKCAKRITFRDVVFPESKHAGGGVSSVKKKKTGVTLAFA